MTNIAKIKEPDPIDVSVGAQIKALRKSKGLSQTDLGDVLGKTFQQVQKYERGSNRVSASVLFKIAVHLDVTPDYFFADFIERATGTEDRELYIRKLTAELNRVVMCTEPVIKPKIDVAA